MEPQEETLVPFNEKPSKKEFRQERRQEKEEIIRKGRVIKKIKKYAAWILILALSLFLIWWLINTSLPKEDDLSASYPDQGRNHVPEKAAHPEYNSNPPTSGWHYAKPADPGYYPEGLADETAIHNLEHGDIWISYHPRVSQEIIDDLRKFIDGKTIVTRRDKNDTDIALAAWTRLDKFNLDGKPLDQTRIKDFIKRHKNKGPEKIPPAPVHSR